jgi:hypothetical protein
MSHVVTREQLQAAREHALAGEYATASVYYEGVAAAITKCVALAEAQRLQRVQERWAAALTARAARRRHVRELGDPAAKRNWLRLRAAVADEADSVAALDAECAALRVGPAQPQRQQPEVRSSADKRTPWHAACAAAPASRNAVTRAGCRPRCATHALAGPQMRARAAADVPVEVVRRRRCAKARALCARPRRCTFENVR